MTFKVLPQFLPCQKKYIIKYHFQPETERAKKKGRKLEKYGTNLGADNMRVSIYTAG